MCTVIFHVLKMCIIFANVSTSKNGRVYLSESTYFFLFECTDICKTVACKTINIDVILTCFAFWPLFLCVHSHVYWGKICKMCPINIVRFVICDISHFCEERRGKRHKKAASNTFGRYLASWLVHFSSAWNLLLQTD